MIHVTRYVQCHQSGEWHIPITRKVHDDVIKWKHFPRYWPFVRGIHRWPVDSPHKGQRCRPFMFSLVYALTSGWPNTRDVYDLRCHRGHYDTIVMHLATYTKTFHNTITCILLRFMTIIAINRNNIQGIHGSNDSLSLVCMWVKIFSIFMHGHDDSSSRASWQRHVNTLKPRQNARHFQMIFLM